MQRTVPESPSELKLFGRSCGILLNPCRRMRQLLRSEGHYHRHARSFYEVSVVGYGHWFAKGRVEGIQHLQRC